MKIIPVLTEKSMALAKDGMYTFWVDYGFNKRDIKKAIEKLFDVHVTGVRTINLRGGRTKKAIVTLAKDEKIDLFEEKGKKK